tara:strand:+ start:12055 stop:13125 length:1071 start_codon:yes stop_codon:yes gene_type:complete
MKEPDSMPEETAKKRINLADTSEERFPFEVGLLATLSVHLFLCFGVPWERVFALSGDLTQIKEYEVVLMEPAAREKRFVEPNPSIAPEEPVDTINEAARSQRAMQQVLAENTDSPDPYVSGELEGSQALMKHTETKSPAAAPSGRIAPNASESSSVLGVRRPKSSFKQTALAEGLNTGSEKSSEKASKKMMAMLDPSIPSGDAGLGSAQKPKQTKQGLPGPRPRLSQATVAGIQMRSEGSAHVRKGLQLAIDARFSVFGAYKQRMFEAIVSQWRLLTDDARGALNSDTRVYVTLTFKLDKEGNVRDLVVKESTASSLGTLLCKDAVLSRAPFGPWTEEMLNELGSEYTLDLKFFYR